MPKYFNKRTKSPIWVSQNFLHDPLLVKQLLLKTNIDKTDHVYEIGPGKDIITRLLLKQCGELTAVELDGRLYNQLKKSLAGAPHLHLVKGDFLGLELPSTGNYKVFSSIPYSITSDILRKLTETNHAASHIYLIMQREAAYRYMGVPRETLRSVLLKPLFQADIMHHFLKTDFTPVPQVDSVLLHLSKKGSPDLNHQEYSFFKDFAAYGFTRGTPKLFRLFTRNQMKHLEQSYGITDLSVPGEISYIQWLALFRCLLNLVSLKRQSMVKDAYQKLCLEQKKLDKRHRTVDRIK